MFRPTMDDDRISESDAARLWERAAELQAQARFHLEARTRESREKDAGSGDPFPEDGYALDDVREAASEAGISPAFMERALVELRHERRDLAIPRDRVDRLADRLLDPPTGSLVVARVIAGDGNALLQALSRVLTGAGRNLALTDIDGEDSLRGATLTFRIPSLWTGNMSSSDLGYRAGWIWADTLHVTVRPAAEGSDGDEGEPRRLAGGSEQSDPGRWEVEFRMPLRKGRRVNAWWSLGTSGFTGAAGAALGAALGVGVATIVGPILGLPAVLAGVAVAVGTGGGAAGSAWGGVRLYRWSWNHGVREMRKMLDETLRQVELQLRTGNTFSLPKPESSGSDDGSITGPRSLLGLP